jgi:hypothetical protein
VTLDACKQKRTKLVGFNMLPVAVHYTHPDGFSEHRIRHADSKRV